MAWLCLALLACGGKSRHDTPEPARLVAIREELGTLNGSWSALSDDGSKAVGTLTLGEPGGAAQRVAVTWTPASGVRSLEPAPERESSLMDVNGDGSNVGGTTNAFGSQQPFVWSRGQISYVPHHGSLDAMSADTRHVVGRFLYKPDFLHAYLWSEQTGRTDLGTLGNEDHSTAVGVSDDGQVVIGSSGETAFRWTEADGMLPLSAPEGKTRSHALDLSRDGRVIVGWSATFDDSSSTITVWNDSEPEEIESLPGARGGEARAVSPDGSVVVGRSDQAFIWSRTQGTRAVRQVLADAGVDVTDWTLTDAVDVSADGSTVLGLGEHAGVETWWVARLPVD